MTLLTAAGYIMLIILANGQQFRVPYPTQQSCEDKRVAMQPHTSPKVTFSCQPAS